MISAGPIGVGIPQPQPHPNIPPQPFNQQRNAALEHQLAHRRARKPHDRNMPEGVEDTVIGNGVQEYKKLREAERKLDYTMIKKRLDIQDAVTRSGRKFKTMRIWISNTAMNQPWQASSLDENAYDFSQAEDGSYRVKIEGRLLEDDEPSLEDEEDEVNQEASDATETKGEDGENKLKASQNTRKRLSHFFKAITVDFDKSNKIQASGEPNQIEWTKPASTTSGNSSASDFDVLEFERKGDENINVTINLTRDEIPERFRLSPALSEVLDADEEDRAGIVLGIWKYIKAIGLQEDEEKRTIRCDERLKAVRNPNHHCKSTADMANRSLVQTQSFSLRYLIALALILKRCLPSSFLIRYE